MIQVRGRFVGKYDLRVGYQRARDGDALPLPSRQLIWPVPCKVAEPDDLQEAKHALPPFAPRDLFEVMKRVFNVLRCGAAPGTG